MKLKNVLRKSAANAVLRQNLIIKFQLQCRFYKEREVGSRRKIDNFNFNQSIVTLKYLVSFPRL